MPSFYTPELDNTKQQLIITKDELHHITHVLRLKAGDEITLNSGTGWLGKGAIASLAKTEVVVDIIQTEYCKLDQNPFALAFSLLRSKNDEWLVEKTTELGVSELFPFQSRYTVRNPSTNTVNRFSQSALSAIKQCNNPWLPSIHEIQSFDHLLKDIKTRGYTAVIASEKMPHKWIDSLEPDVSYCFVIGPEGGFSADEFNMMRQERVIEISLSRLVLRAETAAVTAAGQFALFNKQTIS